VLYAAPRRIALPRPVPAPLSSALAPGTTPHVRGYAGVTGG